MNANLRMIQAKARAFWRAKRGNVAMMFGICLVPLVIATGVGLDYARSMLMKSQMADALDAATLAVGSSGLTADKVQAAAQAYFNANYKGDTTNGVPNITVNNYDPKGSVSVTANGNVSTSLLKIVGVSTIAVSTSSTVVWGQTKLWVAMVLDNSGSMCQPDNQPCINDTNTASKIYQLKSATKSMLTKLQGASVNAGDVMVGIVPFNREVHVPFNSDGTSFPTNSTWIDWSFWEDAPNNVSLSSSVGPGSSCPFTTSSNNQKSPYGYYCVTSASNGASTTSTIPTSGLICPGADSGNYNTDRNDHYYNGCWDSVPLQTLTTTKTDTTPLTTKQACSQTGSGTITCNTTSGPTSGTTTSNTTTSTANGYTGDSGPTVTSNTSTGTNADGTKSCSGSGNSKKCTWTRTISQTKTDTTVTKTGTGGYSHTWQINDHATWSGCLTDRYSQTSGTPTPTSADNDTKNIAPGNDTTGFTADNPTGGCPVAGVSALVADSTASDVTALGKVVDKMQAAGSTNQAIGVAHGWQMLTQGNPYGTLALPANTTRYIILLSDGLNTQDRWWGDGGTEGTTQDGYIDNRMKLTCDAAKADGVVIYTLYVHVNGGGNSTPLQNCATDTGHYYDLTTASAINAAFADIAQKITNVRVSQ